MTDNMIEMKTLTVGDTTFEIVDEKARQMASSSSGGGSGVYVGSGDMPEGYNIQIDPEGEAEDLVTREEFSQLQATVNDLKENGTGTGTGLTQAQITALDGMFKVVSYSKADVSAEYEAFKTAFGIESGGEVEPDTPTEPDEPIEPDVPDIPETGVSNETTWTDGVAYTYTPVDGSYVDTDGTVVEYASWSRTPYLYCKGASKLRIKVVTPSGTYNPSNDKYNCFYDENKNFIQSFAWTGVSDTEVGSYVDVDVPENATYLIMSGKGMVISTTGTNNTGKPYLEFIPYA